VIVFSLLLTAMLAIRPGSGFATDSMTMAWTFFSDLAEIAEYPTNPRATVANAVYAVMSVGVMRKFMGDAIVVAITRKNRFFDLPDWMNAKAFSIGTALSCRGIRHGDGIQIPANLERWGRQNLKGGRQT
jgi:hypothetical protein